MDINVAPAVLFNSMFPIQIRKENSTISPVTYDYMSVFLGQLQQRQEKLRAPHLHLSTNIYNFTFVFRGHTANSQPTELFKQNRSTFRNERNGPYTHIPHFTNSMREKRKIHRAVGKDRFGADKWSSSGHLRPAAAAVTNRSMLYFNLRRVPSLSRLIKLLNLPASECRRVRPLSVPGRAHVRGALA